jgi:hypothetical protein
LCEILGEEPTGVDVVAKLSINIPDGTLRDLEELAKQEGDKTATRAAYLLQKQVEQLVQPEAHVSKQEFEQIAEFLRLLVGDRESPHGVSFAVVAGLTGVELAKLRRLYHLVKRCKEEIPEAFEEI